MAKQAINVGTAANDKKGDSLRAAFQKVNANFTELYTELGLVVDANLNLGAFEFAGSTISTTDSTAIVIDQSVTVSSDLSVGGDLLPQTANGGDLGSSTLPWRSLHVSNNTVFFGGVPLSLEAGSNTLKINNVPISQTIDISDLTDTEGLLGGGGVTSYNDLTNKPTLFSGSYNDLTNKPTLFSGSYNDLINKPDLAGTYQFSVAADDSTQRVISTDEVIKFIGAGGITTASDAEGNITITGPSLTGLATETYVTTRGYITGLSYNDLTDKPNIAGTYQFSVAADDSTQRVISTDEVIKFIGAGGITTASDAEGNITITGSGGSVSSLVNGAYTVSLGSTGTLTVPADGIITAPINQEFQLQAKDANSVLRNEINLDPNNGTYMSVWSDETTSFSSADWGSGSWNNEGGLGAARFTDAQALQNFWTTGIGSTVSGIEVSINGGARSPNVFYENNNGGGYGVYLGLDAVPPGGQGTTVPITSLVFYYQLQSKINMDVTGNEILLDAQAMDLDLRTTLNLDLRANQNLNLRGLGAYPVRIYTNGTTHMWEFGTDGRTTFPSGMFIESVMGNALISADPNVIIAIETSGPDSAAVLAWTDIDPVTSDQKGVTIGAFNGNGSPYAEISVLNHALSGSAQEWRFNDNGSLTFPNATVQTTAWTGTVGTQATLNVTGAVTAERFNTDQITVVSNRISTTVTNANLELECNGSGGVVINAIADATTASTVKSVGYLGLPQSATATDGTLAIGDAGKHIYVTTSGQTIAIPDNASVAYPIGTTLTFIAGPSIDRVLIVVNGGSDTLRLAGSTSTGTRTLAANGMATAVKVASTLWYINGIGLT